MSRKAKLNEWKRWKGRYGMTEIDGGFYPKLDPWTIGDTGLYEEKKKLQMYVSV